MPGFAKDIQPLFTQEDIEHMLGVDPDLNLGSYDSVKKRVNDIYRMVSFGAMPPGHPWPKSQGDLFKRWMDAGSPR
ncbi:MAG TPA: hypothetical protein VFU72_04960 [Nitrolancea sp.]|nr:hypothetical protein [Nitrolancea sp.]